MFRDGKTRTNPNLSENRDETFHQTGQDRESFPHTVPCILKLGATLPSSSSYLHGHVLQLPQHSQSSDSDLPLPGRASKKPFPCLVCLFQNV